MPPVRCTRPRPEQHPGLVIGPATVIASGRAAASCSHGVTMTHQFLSEPWMDEVQRIKATHEGNPIDQEGLIVNVTVTGVPFGTGTLEVHSDHGPVINFSPGHVPDPAFSITLDYAIAHELVMDRTLNVLEQAINADQITITGDRSAFRDWWHSRIGNPDAVLLDDQIRAVTS